MRYGAVPAEWFHQVEISRSASISHLREPTQRMELEEVIKTTEHSHENFAPHGFAAIFVTLGWAVLAMGPKLLYQNRLRPQVRKHEGFSCCFEAA